MSKETSTKQPEVFDIKSSDKGHDVVHVVSGTAIVSYKDGTLAAGFADSLNGLSKKGPSAWRKFRDKAKGEGTIAAINQAFSLVNPGKSMDQEIQSKDKNRDSYTGQRQNFAVQKNITEFEKEILQTVEKLSKNSRQGITAYDVAVELGVSTNRVTGSISVLLAKNIVSTKRDRVDGKICRVINIEYNEWSSLPVGSASSTKPKAEKPKEDKPKADKPKATEAPAS